MSGRGTWPAPAYRSVDQLSGRVAELERSLADAEAQRDDWHPLDALCTCGHQKWLHTTGCLALVRAGTSHRKTTRCDCRNGCIA